MSSPSKQAENLKVHALHLHTIAKGSKSKRDEILKNASPNLIEALSTALRVLDENGYKFAKAHQRRARRMMSKNTAKRTKKELVAGKQGTQSRGGGFWKDISKALIDNIPVAVPITL